MAIEYFLNMTIKIFQKETTNIYLNLHLSYGGMVYE